MFAADVRRCLLGRRTFQFVEWTASDTIAVVSVLVAGASSALTALHQSKLRAADRREVRADRREADYRASRDRAVAALVETRALLNEFTPENVMRRLSTRLSGSLVDAFDGPMMAQAAVLPGVVRSLNEIAAGHPDANVRRRAERVSVAAETYFADFHGTLRAKIVLQDDYDATKDLVEATELRAAALEALQALTDQLHSTPGD